jgi:GNAT superfamily N-acetyltransferase
MMIRKAELHDIPEMVELLGELFSIEKDFRFDRDNHERGLRMMIENPDGRIIMTALDNGRIIGICSGQLSVSTVEGGWSLWIEDLIVTAGYRGKGIGSELIRSVAGWGKANGAVRLQLLADRDNLSALEFYKRGGWVTGNMICLRKKEF